MAVQDGRSLEVYIDRSPACGEGEPEAFVLEFCGNGARAEDMTAWLANQRWRQFPVEVWCLNYPGFGQSTGPAKLAAIPPAALNAYDALRHVAGDRPIILEGNSLGSATALYVATKRPTPWMVLQNPPPLRRLIMVRHGWWNLWMVAIPVALQVPTPLNTLDTAPDVPAELPALFIQCQGDTLVPAGYQDLVHEAYGGPKTVVRIPNIDHNDPIPSAYERQVQAWIRDRWDRTIAK